MSISDVIQGMHRNADELEAAVSGRSSDRDCQEALKAFLMAQYSSLSSLAWFLGCDPQVFQDEAVPAADIVDDAYFDLMLEREFSVPAGPQVYSTLNHAQQGISR